MKPDAITLAMHPALANITANHWCWFWISIYLQDWRNTSSQVLFFLFPFFG